jgi:hypothetical protein
VLEQEPEFSERAALRWVGRYCFERPDATLEDVKQVRDAFVRMLSDPSAAVEVLEAATAQRRPAAHDEGLASTGGR